MEDTNEMTNCGVCGRPVLERDGRTGRPRPYHLACRNRYEASMRKSRAEQQARLTEENLLAARQRTVVAANLWRDAIEDRNRAAAKADREAVARIVWSVRLMTLLAHLEPERVTAWSDPTVTRLGRELGRDAMDRLMDQLRWIGPRPWRTDTDVSREGTLDRTIEGQWTDPSDIDPDAYHDDLDHLDLDHLDQMGQPDQVDQTERTTQRSSGRYGPGRRTDARTIGAVAIIDRLWSLDHAGGNRTMPWTIGEWRTR